MRAHRYGPDIISPVSSSSTNGDGRHRTFTWTVPRDNGYAITSYTLRRTHTTTQVRHAEASRERLVRPTQPRHACFPSRAAPL